ncbi:hypothetical protein Q5P01_024033 [Channa striata]|uniref:Uncharacterized protein n=1 Tax=Channa striata TaxID=64152 RepID=A0AA88LKU1_CHASR|nr:hypothetical protein Q5P01_024033 [Channa striata]
MVSSYEPSSALQKAVEELNAYPEGRIEGFLATWGYAFVVEVGRYYSRLYNFEVFSTCNKDAEESLDDAAEHCRETGAKFKVEGFGAGASPGGSTAGSPFIRPAYGHVRPMTTLGTQRYTGLLGSKTHPFPVPLTPTSLGCAATSVFSAGASPLSGLPPSGSENGTIV